jgi:hypothetical protein
LLFATYYGPNLVIYSGEEIHKGLKKVLNQEEPKFRSDEQREAVFAAIDQQTPMIVVLPTGGGKNADIYASSRAMGSRSQHCGGTV